MSEKIPRSEKRNTLLKLIKGGVGEVALTDQLVTDAKPHRAIPKEAKARPAVLSNLINGLPSRSEIARGGKKEVYYATEALATAGLADGRTARLNGVIFSGNSAIGIISVCEPNQYVPAEVKLSVLPWGEQQNINGHKNSARVLATQDIAKLGELRPQGYIQSWEDLSMGRGVGNTVQIEDGMTSAQHAKVSIDAKKLTVNDLNSTNGTRLLIADDLYLRNGVEDFSSETIDMYQTLVDQPWTWSPDYDNVTVVPQV